MQEVGSPDLLDHQRHVRSLWRRKDHYHSPPRLLTPEASRSSDGSLDEQSPREPTRGGSQIPALLSCGSPGPRLAVLGSMPHSSYPTHKGLGPNSAPYSPPYRSVDVQRPSLPPLKTVLGDRANSPPDTPMTQDTVFQPSPQEPSVLPSMFKPTSLYPNKKLRVDSVLQPSPDAYTVRPWTCIRPSVKSDVELSDYLARRPLPSPRFANRIRSDARADALSHETWDATSQRPQGLEGPSYHRSSAEYGSASSAALNKRDYATESATDDRRYLPQPESPYSYTTDTSVPPYEEAHARYGERGPMRQSEHTYHRASTYEALEVSPRIRNPRIGSPGAPEAHYSLPVRNEHNGDRSWRQYRGRPEEAVHMMNGIIRDSHHGQPAFFMPNHFEYQQGKTRKRSNLPKQSTEIMKTWFDQNISNPYPSEEQKAIFSSATGISMTQVSNWFINHRRRCPELRDRRDRLRTADGRD